MHWNLGEAYIHLRLYLTEHPGWIILLTYFLAALEGVAVVGAVIPGVALMFGLSVLAGSADLSAESVIIAGALGAISGDGLSHAIGRRYKHRIDKVWPFRTHPQWLSASEAFVERNGGKSLILGRFIGPLRAFVPLATGIFEMPLKRYLTFSILAGMAWAPVHILPGYFIGSAVTAPSLPDEDQLLFLGALLIAVAVLTWLLPFLAQASWKFRQRHAPSNVGTYHADNGKPEDQLLSLALSTVALLGFAVMAVALPWFQHIDQVVSNRLFGLREPAMDHLFLAFSLLGDRPALCVISAFITLWLLLRREWHTLLHVLAATALAFALPMLMKHLFQTPRPHFLMESPPSYAFPSGHAFSAVLCWGFLYIVVARQLDRELRPWLLAFALGVIVLTSASRIYLGVHWLSDIIGGLSLGVAAIGVLRWSWYRREGIHVSAWESSFAVIMAVAFSAVLVVLPAWPFAWVSYEPLDSHGVIIKRHSPLSKALHHKPRPPHARPKLF